MNDEQITPKRRGRPPKNPDARIGNTSLQSPPPIRETPTIKEGAHWQVGVPEDEQDELKRRHNEAMQNKQTEARQELEHLNIAVAMDAMQQNELTQDSAIQIKEGPNRGVICQVGQIEGDTVMCYQQLINGEKTFLSTKMGEFIVLCPRRSGMVAMVWERKESAPTWHDNKTHVPEGNQ